MRMKKLIFMFLAILLCGIVQAQTSEIILNNGKVVKGKIQSLSFNVPQIRNYAPNMIQKRK